MSIPVEAATVMFAPQPVRSSRTILEPEPRPRRRSSLNKNVYFEIFKRNSGTPSIFDEFLQGWSSPASNNDTGSPVEIVSFQRPQNPAPEHQSTIEEEQDEDEEEMGSLPDESFGTPRTSTSSPVPFDRRTSFMSSSSNNYESFDETTGTRTRRMDSVQVGNHINDLLGKDEVKHAVSALQQATQHMNMTDLNPEHNDEQVADTYSDMLERLCEPNMAKLINQISGIDLKSNPQSIYNCVMWRMFTKVVECGFQLRVSFGYSYMHLQMSH